MTILIYGLASTATERWQEDLLCSCAKNSADVRKVKEAASKDGYHSFRTSVYIEGEKPDFGSCVNV